MKAVRQIYAVVLLLLLSAMTAAAGSDGSRLLQGKKGDEVSQNDEVPAEPKQATRNKRDRKKPPAKKEDNEVSQNDEIAEPVEEPVKSKEALRKQREKKKLRIQQRREERKEEQLKEREKRVAAKEAARAKAEARKQKEAERKARKQAKREAKRDAKKAAKVGKKAAAQEARRKRRTDKRSGLSNYERAVNPMPTAGDEDGDGISDCVLDMRVVGCEASRSRSHAALVGRERSATDKCQAADWALMCQDQLEQSPRCEGYALLDVEIKIPEDPTKMFGKDTVVLDNFIGASVYKDQKFNFYFDDSHVPFIGRRWVRAGDVVQTTIPLPLALEIELEELDGEATIANNGYDVAVSMKAFTPYTSGEKVGVCYGKDVLSFTTGGDFSTTAPTSQEPTMLPTPTAT